MLSKMFPKAGQTVPEIRLDGFEGEWEEKYIGELTDIVRGKLLRDQYKIQNGLIQIQKLAGYVSLM